MDNVLLISIADEARTALLGAALGDIVQIDSRRFALRFSVPPFHRLCIATHPDLCALYLAPRVEAPKVVTELAAVLSERVGGATVAAIRKAPGDRIIEIDLAGGAEESATLVVELLGRSSNLLLLNRERRVVRSLRSHDTESRRAAEGAVYSPPEPRPSDASRPWGSLLLGREIESRVGAGESRDALRRAIAGTIDAGEWEPCLYAPRALPNLTEADDLTPDRFFPAPFPLKMAEGLVRTDFRSACEAVRHYVDLLVRHLAFRDLRTALSGLVRLESGRSRKLVATLEREASNAADADRTSRRGELLMASLGVARREATEVEVVDYFDPELPKVRIPLEPGLDLRENAAALFRRAKKLKRASGVIATRLSETRRRLEALEESTVRIGAAASSEALSQIEARLTQSGLVRVFRKPERREPGRRPSFLRVREYRTRDGRTILVGRTAAENDFLTFKIAAPHDFWFHAAGRAGAHVVLRNPGRAKQVPEPALIEAAAIAAWFSKGARDSEIEVHYCQRKEVRKGKGMSPGMVMLRNHRTVSVAPALPKEFAASDEEEPIR